MEHLLGVDIGGTKSAVCLGTFEGEVLDRHEVSTSGEPMDLLESLAEQGRRLGSGVSSISAIGIVCGGPLDLFKGRVLSPPNLPGWDNVPVVDFFASRFGVPVGLQNDANAGALAEWKFGAGVGCDNLMFCTMGTGFGCGLILGGRLYGGTNGNAGELGHVRLTPSGPMGYGKAGSVEGWCSGGGIAQIAKERVASHRQANGTSKLFDTTNLTARDVAEAAASGDRLAIEIFEEVGTKLGLALAIALDLLNLETIIIGSIFTRQESLIRPAMERVLEQECLPGVLEACRVKPSGLGEQIGDVAALTVALETFEKRAL